MFGHVDKAARGHLARHDIEVARHREIAVNPLALGKFGMVAFGNPRMAPHWNDALAFGCREEIPVAEPVADHGVGHIVRSYRKALDSQAHRTIGQRALIQVDNFGLGQFGLVDMNLLHHFSPNS